MKYIFGFIIAFILIIILVVMLVSGGGKNDTPAVSSPKTLVSYSTSGAIARLTVDGSVNSQQEHVQDQITVSKDQVVYKRIGGYEGRVIETRVYDNNSSAYGAFLQSLNRAGFDKGNNDPEHKDERGYCPQGNRYVYELIDGDKTIQRYWSTSCAKPQTYLGSEVITLDLFKRQVPDYGKTGSKFQFGTNF